MTSLKRSWAVIGIVSLATWGVALCPFELRRSATVAAERPLARVHAHGATSMTHEPTTFQQRPTATRRASLASEETRPAPPTPVVSQAAVSSVSMSGDELRSACPTNVRLAATVHNARAPRRSLALLRAADAKRASLLRTGGRVGEYVLQSIRPRAVLLRAEHGQCVLRMTREHASAAGSTARSDARRSPTPTAPAARIEQLGPDRYRVERRVLSNAFSAAKARGWLRMQISRGRDGIEGMRVYKLDRTGLVAKLGLKRGDVLQTLNGHSLTSLDGMHAAQRELDSARHLTLNLMRFGTPRSVSYDLR